MPSISSPLPRSIVLATRGSALALAQTNLVLAQCRLAFPTLRFESRIIKTTGDKLQTAPPDVPGMAGTKGLFTKELEVALLNGEADLAVHSLKDLPTELPDGLDLCAVLPRADVRDVLICRGEAGSEGKSGLRDLIQGGTVATSSTRRQAQLLERRPDLKVVPIRGNVGTRLQKLVDQPGLAALVLAAAGLQRLSFQIFPSGSLGWTPKDGRPAGLRASYLSVEEMVPCVGQGAIGLEGRIGDKRMEEIFAHLNEPLTLACVTAERAFLRALGGGCLSPVAAYAEISGNQLRLRAVSFRTAPVRRTERLGMLAEAAQLGREAADELRE